MQDKDILEGNFLISKFMGWTYPDLKTFERDMAFHESHHYDKRWDKLMSVVEKIDGLGVADIQYNSFKSGSSQLLVSVDGVVVTGVIHDKTQMKEAYYQAVVQFITWYNSHQK